MTYIVGQGSRNDPRSLDLQTRRKWRIPNELRPELPLAVRMEAIRIVTKEFPSARALSSSGRYNCAGLVFGSRRVAIDVEHAEKILHDDGYAELDWIDRETWDTGDVVVYRDAKCKPSHVAMIHSVTPDPVKGPDDHDRLHSRGTRRGRGSASAPATHRRTGGGRARCQRSDCPKTLAAEIIERARKARGDRAIQVVLAKVEYEAWFLAAAESLADHRGIKPDVVSPSNPEAVQDAKGWISKWMEPGRSYSPSTDQPALTAVFDMDVARKRAPSFDKLYHAVESMLVD